MTINALSAASIAIYIIYLQPTLYILYRHGWPGFLGWFYLHLFILVRIIGNGLSIHQPLHPSPLFATSPSSSSSSDGGGNSKATLIVNNIGLSPLLLATSGLLHEARRARRAGGESSTFEWVLVGQYHLMVSGAVALIVAGVVLLEEGKVGELDTAKAVMKAGAAVLVVVWALLVGATVASLVGSRGQRGVALDWRAGNFLMHAVVVALPLIALRLGYGVAVLLLDVTGHATSKFALSLTAKVVMSTVPEMVLMLAFIVVGVMTRDIAGAYWKKGEKRRGVKPEIVDTRPRSNRGAKDEGQDMLGQVK